MKKISLTQNKFAIVNDEDYDWLNRWRWFAAKIRSGYMAVRTDYSNGQKAIYMHRLILNAPAGSEVDHRNHCELDNRRCNIRVCTPSQNQQNQRIRKGTSSVYKGVAWCKRTKKWLVQIKYNYKNHYIGYFDNEDEAARAYDNKAIKLFGEFAQLNLR